MNRMDKSFKSNLRSSHKQNTKNGTKNAENPTKDKRIYGLSTQRALARLHDEIEKLLHGYEKKFNEENCYLKLRSAFVKHYDCPLGWFTIITTLFTILALLCCHSYMTSGCLAAILILDLYVIIRENNLRRSEIYRKTRHILNELKLAEQKLCSEWKECNYPHLCSPMSPCVSLQYTYRDNVIVNLPWALLVRGDHIVMRPGFITPGPCIEVDGKRSFKAHEIYGVTQIGDHPPVKPVARSPLPDIVCCLENTPYLDNLRISLENSLKRPPTIYNQQRYLLVSKYIQQWAFIAVICLTLFIGILRIYGFGVPNAGGQEQNYYKQILIESTTAAVIPLLPLIFPIMWISMNLWGIARLQSFLETPQAMIEKNHQKLFEEDLDTPTYNFEHISLLRSNVLRNWLYLWGGDSKLLPRSSNVVQVLGSITALCCVDKKGILSWPNPTAEKVFFLRNVQGETVEEQTNSQLSVDTNTAETDANVDKEKGVTAEVLDLTHDQHCPFRLEFDDHDWKTHIKSLKPLGLAILLNTCSPSTHAHYAQFCGHVTAVAMTDKDLVPVTNRYAIIESSMNSFLHGRCLCELAKQIGFTDHATDRFLLEGQLASYRHLQPDVVRRDIRFARQLQLSSKVKVPFPHSLSVVMRENPGGYLSLFTQGTADMILDCCDDFWDGKDLRPLSQQDRKRALDFYQRSALTAYCTAFSYRPLRHGIVGGLGTNKKTKISYLQLPPESKIRMPHVDKAHCDFENDHAKLSHSISTDSLLFSDAKDEDIDDVDSCYEMQCHQVFIGMVTMQYQAQTDIVQLIERLERACIRFVHFSKDNELRSRVFSEKMGLESGWNCHISLLSENDGKLLTTTTTTSVATTAAQTTTATTTTTATSTTTKCNDAAQQPILAQSTAQGHGKNLMNLTTTTTAASTSTKITCPATNINLDENCINNNNNIITNNITTTTTTSTTITTTNIINTNNCIKNNNINMNSSLPSPSISSSLQPQPQPQPQQASSQLSYNDDIIIKTIQSSSTSINQPHNNKHNINKYVDKITDDANDDDDDDDDDDNVDNDGDDSELNWLLLPANLESTKALSSSAPGAISNQDCNMLNICNESPQHNNNNDNMPPNRINSLNNIQNDINDDDDDDNDNDDDDNDDDDDDNDIIDNIAITMNTSQKPHHQSQDSALDENCRSLSILTESTEQSAPIHFDMSNRAKLPRGIENIRPHLENVDNVPLQVSLFTDCSAEATSQMLDIMQCYGEIVVCLGSSASNSNADIFLQSDCSIAVEPLYPQVCQDIPAYTETNILNNRLLLKKREYNKYDNENLSAASIDLLENGIKERPMQTIGNTISPIYLSRLLNALPCSISVCRDDPLSLVAIIELSRRFSSGLWNCIQFWACSAGIISALNLFSACLSMPPILTPFLVIYLMCIPVPLIALALAHIDVDPQIMNRATGKKQTEYDSRVFGFVMWCYGCKFFTPLLIMILSYCAFMAHPIDIIDVDTSAINLRIARNFSLLGILWHFVIISSSFVHRDHSLWQRNPFRNRIWTVSCLILLIIHSIFFTTQIILDDDQYNMIGEVWPAIVLMYGGGIISLIVSEITKWQEIKVNSRYQRRARLDFGTKLGMNSPF